MVKPLSKRLEKGIDLWFCERDSLRMFGHLSARTYGLRNANVSSNLGRDIDQLLEAVVYREMRRRGYSVTIGRVKEKEIDFVCQKGEDRQYIQVAYLMPTQETREREFGALLSVPDQHDKLVLSMDHVDFSAYGIRHSYLPDFLVK